MMAARAHKAKLRDTSGASIVIALVFFLICAIIGSAVLTAASVQAKATATHRETQQAEFSVGSAARLLGSQLNAPVTVQRDAAGKVSGAALAEPPADGSFAEDFWSEYGAGIMAAYGKKKDFTLTGLAVTQTETDAVSGGSVTGTIVVSKDLDIDIDLVFNKANASNPLYRMHVYLQCIPTFDVQGNLLSLAYEDAVITKGDSR